MEKIAGTISDLFEEELGLYQTLQSVIEQEKAYVIDMDIDGLWASVDRKRELLEAIEKIRERIRSLSPDTGGGKGLSTSKIVKNLPLKIAEKSRLKTLGLAVDTCKKEITRLARENKKYITEYLSVIDGIFSTVVNLKNKDQYGNQGTISRPKDQPPLIQTKV
ncbi:flagellar export chaperone FlgN [Desulfospira joergensenii]|uniref:flagellar export chaperone FlgN n=1 Tax=Desulfospira joergensenii TaxID=53329 RepID=UPI0003B3FCD2|nr:flagellar export chaperone FlgN [Desulfospira joergensenii]